MHLVILAFQSINLIGSLPLAILHKDYYSFKMFLVGSNSQTNCYAKPKMFEKLQGLNWAGAKRIEWVSNLSF